IRNHVLIFFLFISRFTFACDCPPLAPFSKTAAEQYDVVFYGKVTAVNACDEKGRSTAYFLASELYKGNCEKEIRISFDCMSSCMMSFAKDEEWIIYAKYEKFDLLKADFCEHSRKKFPDDSQDIYLWNSRSGFDKEKEDLKALFGLQNFIASNDLQKQHDAMGPRNEQPSGYSKLILLLISISAMGIVFYVIKRKKK